MDPESDEFLSDVQIFSMGVGLQPYSIDGHHSATVGTVGGGYVYLMENRKSNGDCVGSLESRICALEPSTMLYNISMSGSNVTFSSNSWKDDIFVQYRFVEPRDK